VAYLYTIKNANLGSISTQRGESYHQPMREITNGQLSLDQSAARLLSKVSSILKDIRTNEAQSQGSYLRLV